nr:reverse transcriptase domain-containing protein [Tanacetum cinerariifolium]
VTVVRGSLAEVDGGCGVGTKVVAARGGELCGGSSRSGEVECFWFWPESSSKKFSGGGDGGRSPEFLPISWSVDDDANKHLDKFLHVTQSIKVNGVTDDALRLYLFSHSLTHHVTAWFDRLPRNSINTFEHMAKMFLEKYFPPSMVTKLRNEITNFRQRPDESLFEAWECYKLSIDRCPNHNMFPVTQIDTFYNGLNLRHRDTINVAARGTFMKRRPEECYDLIENMTAHHNNWDTSAQRSDSSSSITSSYDTEIAALKAEMEKINKNLMRVLQVNQHVKAVTLSCETCGGPHSFNDCPASVGNSQNIYAAGAYQGQKQSQAYQAAAYQAPVYQASVHQPQIPQPQVVTTNEYINFMKVNDAILKNMQTNITSLTNLNLELKNMFGQFMKMNIASSSGSGTLPGNIITNPKEDLKGITTRRGTAYLGPLIPTSSSSVVERRTEATKDTMNPTNNGSTEDVQPLVVLTESLILTSEPVNSLIIEPVASPVNLNFNISFADTLILMPKFGLSIKSLLTNKDKLCELARTPLNAHCSAVLLKKLPEKLGDPELADRLISRPVRVAKDVFVKVGELTLCVGKEAITFNLDQTSRYSANYNDMTANRIDVIEMACEEYSQEVLGFSDMIASGNPTSYYDPIVSTTSSTLTPFENSDFLLEEVDSFLALEDDPTLIEVDQSYLDTEGDILLLEPFLNDDPSLTSPNQGNYLLEVHRELKICKAKSDKSSIDEPPEVELKDLPPHLEYAFLEGDDKLPVIIAKDLSMEEKIALITVLKSHKRAISWKLSDIKGIDPEFCTHKILVEEDFEPAPSTLCTKKGAFTAVENEENELIPTCLVTRWRVCIDYRISKFPSIRKIRRKPHSSAHTECLLTVACVLGYAMHRARFKEKILKRCEDTNLCLNWEKSYFMVKEGIVLGHKISKEGIKVDKAKGDVITKLPHPTTIKECVEAFQTLKRKLTEAPILIAPDWDMPFELMCDASDFAIGVVLGQRQEKHFRPIYYASKTMIEAKSNYNTTEKEMLAVVYTFEKFQSYLIMNKSIMYTDHSALKYLFVKKDSKARLLLPHGLLTLQTTMRGISLSIECRPNRKVNSSRMSSTISGTTPFCLKYVLIKSSEDVYMARKPLIFLRLATMDPPGDTMAKITQPRSVTQCLATAYHPQNKWSGGAYKTPIGCTPYKLVYGKAGHLPIELEHKVYWSLKHAMFDLQTAGDHRKVQLNELRDQAYENSLIYKEKTKRLHDSKIKDRVFNIGDRVLLFNSRLKIFSSKLKSRWSGPFTISHVFPYGTVELSQPDGPNFKVNGHRLKDYFGENVPKMVVPDL